MSTMAQSGFNQPLAIGMGFGLDQIQAGLPDPFQDKFFNF